VEILAGRVNALGRVADPREVAHAAEANRPDAASADGIAVPIRSNVLDDATRAVLIRVVTMRPIEAMRQEVERRMLRGERFTDVEEAIDSSDFSADEKAALWLLGWSYVHPRAQRREANAHLAALTRADPPRIVGSGRRLRIVR
jgi:hypothetical protein